MKPACGAIEWRRVLSENQNQNQNQNNNQNKNNNYGKQIGNSVRDALQSGDLSQLKNIGPAVQGAVQQGIGTAGEAMQKAAGHMQAQPGQDPQPYAPPRQPSSRPAWQGSAAHTGAQPAPAAQKPRRVKKRSYFGMAALVVGMVGVLLFASLAFIVGLFSLVFSSLAAVLALLLVPLAAAFIFLGFGISRRALAGRAGKYYDILAGKSTCTFEDLSGLTGKPVEKVRKDAKRMLEHEIYPDLWVDAQGTCLIRGEENWKLYLESEKARKERETEEAERKRRLDDPATAGLEAFRQEGAEAQRKLRKVRDSLREAEIVAKLDKLEGTTKKIFDYVEKHPGKLPDTRKFMNYYLPTTLKLVEKYHQFEEMDVQMDNVVKARAEIERSFDTIDMAFNNLLESLYHEDTMDVTTDIEVLQAMLEQEGLMGKKFEIEADGLH